MIMDISGTDSLPDDNEALEDDEKMKELYQLNVASLRNLAEKFPETVTILEKPCGSKVYIVGTCHFSEESVSDVKNVIEKVVPDCVLLELCRLRSKMLLFDDETFREELRNFNLWKLVKTEGSVRGLMNYLMLRMNQYLVSHLQILPGSEFRAAFQKVKDVPTCHVILADRPIDITLKRVLASLGLWGRLKFFFCLTMGLKPISKEEIERMKKADILEELLKELTVEFPSLSKVIVDERDRYLTKTIWNCVEPVDEKGQIPSVNVAVVGIGHASGIVKYWDQAEDINLNDLCRIDKPPLSWTLFITTIRLLGLTCVSYFGYKVINFAYRFIRSFV